MGNQFNRAITMNELHKANMQCKKGVLDKDAPVDWFLHSITKIKKLKDDIENNKYKVRKGTTVLIFRPKKREATAPSYRDRVWQRYVGQPCA